MLCTICIDWTRQNTLCPLTRQLHNFVHIANYTFTAIVSNWSNIACWCVWSIIIILILRYFVQTTGTAKCSLYYWYICCCRHCNSCVINSFSPFVRGLRVCICRLFIARWNVFIFPWLLALISWIWFYVCICIIVVKYSSCGGKMQIMNNWYSFSFAENAVTSQSQVNCYRFAFVSINKLHEPS